MPWLRLKLKSRAMDQRLGQEDSQDQSESAPRNENHRVLASPIATLVPPGPGPLDSGGSAAGGISESSSRSMSTSVGQDGARKDSAIATACLACVNLPLSYAFVFLFGERSLV